MTGFEDRKYRARGRNLGSVLPLPIRGSCAQSISVRLEPKATASKFFKSCSLSDSIGIHARCGVAASQPIDAALAERPVNEEYSIGGARMRELGGGDQILRWRAPPIEYSSISLAIRVAGFVVFWGRPSGPTGRPRWRSLHEPRLSEAGPDTGRGSPPY